MRALGFRGAQIGPHAEGVHLDGERLRPLLAAAHRGYTRPKSVIFNAAGQPFDWYATTDNLCYS